jgi:hypothetical protein
MNLLTLGRFDFEGLPIGASVNDLKHYFPTAAYADDKTDAQVEFGTYRLAKAKTADGAKFYFFRDSLYQMEIEYNKARADAVGGMAVMVDNLISRLGPPDYADAWRRTWFQPGCNRRADFYVTDDGASLVVTDTSRSALIDRRLHDVELKKEVEFGFEPEQR